MADINDINEHFREALLDTIPCAVFMVNLSNQIIYWNKSTEELTGYLTDEIVGFTCDKLRMSICTNRDPAIMKTLCPLLSEGKGGEVECEIRRKDGSIIPIMRKSRAVFDDKGKLIGAIEALIDVSLIKQARTEIRLLKHEIARRGKYGNLIGRSDQMRKLYDMIETVARTDASIVIEGETGTGKELVAKTIHAESVRSKIFFLLLTVEHYRSHFWNRNFLVTNVGPLPGQVRIGMVVLKLLRAVHYFLMKSAKCHYLPRLKCFVFFRKSK